MPFYCPECRKKIKYSDKFCGKCGRDLSLPSSNTNSRNSVQQFSQQLIRLNNKANITTNGNNKTDAELELIEKQKIALIQSFPIPNVKEEIVDFLVLANSNITIDAFFDCSKTKRELADAWAKKYEQAYQKACIILDDTSKLNIIHEDYLKKMDYVEQKRKANLQESEKYFQEAMKSDRIAVKIGIVVLVLMIILSFAAGYFALNFFIKVKESAEAENQRLELILDDINEAINNHDYEKARNITTKLNFTSSYNFEGQVEIWNEKRNEMYDLIDKLEAKDKDAETEE